MENKVTSSDSPIQEDPLREDGSESLRDHYD